MNEDEQADIDAMYAQAQLEERRRIEDEALARHRILLDKFHAEWKEFEACCARFDHFLLTHAAGAAYEQR